MASQTVKATMRDVNGEDVFHPHGGSSAPLTIIKNMVSTPGTGFAHNSHHRTPLHIYTYTQICQENRMKFSHALISIQRRQKWTTNYYFQW